MLLNFMSTFSYEAQRTAYAVVPLRFVTLLLNCHEVNNFKINCQTVTLRGMRYDALLAHVLV